jgi:hypothetical protein
MYKQIHIYNHDSTVLPSGETKLYGVPSYVGQISVSQVKKQFRNTGLIIPPKLHATCGLITNICVPQFVTTNEFSTSSQI